MRLPFPTRIPVKAACIFALVLMVGQILENTPPLFALCCFLFIMIATTAFNLAGGFSRPSGGYIFFYATLVLIIGLVAKLFIGERADSNLRTPMRDITIYLLSIAGLYLAVFISRKLTPKKGLLQDMVNDRNMLDAAVGCMVTGIILTATLIVSPPTNGSIMSAINQVNRFMPMAIIMGTIYQVRKSGGTSSVNSIVLISVATVTAMGLVLFSKEGMFIGTACWLMAASSQRYRLSLAQIIGLILAATFMSTYLVPYSQYGRSYTEGPDGTNFERSIFLLSHLTQVKDAFNADQKDAVSNSQSYFGRDMGFLERLQMIGPDDQLIAVTEERGPFGLLPIYTAFGNLVPHFIWPDKPQVISGNAYAHEIGGMIDDEDTTTGISFSPSAEGYHLMRWYGILLLAPIIWTLLFIVFDAMCGDTRAAPWGLLMLVVFGHVAPEGMLGGAIYVMGYGSAAVLVAAFSAAYVMPIIGGLIKGSQRTVEVPMTGTAARGRLAAPGTGQ